MYHPLIKPNLTIREFEEPVDGVHVSLIQILGPGVLRTSYVVTVGKTAPPAPITANDSKPRKAKDNNRRFWSIDKAQEYFEFQMWRLNKPVPVPAPIVPVVATPTQPTAQEG